MEFEKAVTVLEKKNHDYTNSFDPLYNFKLAEYLNIADTDKAIFVRLLDKVSRTATFLQNPAPNPLKLKPNGRIV